MNSTYNYLEAMTSDILTVIHDEYTNEQIAYRLAEDFDGFREDLYEALWIDDAVTGNGSGSYTFCRETARQYVLDNTDLLRDVVQEYEIEANEILQRFIDEDWEYFDVCIRCSLLGLTLEGALAELMKEVFD